MLPDHLEILPSPAPLHGADLTPQSVSEGWSGENSTLNAIALALKNKRGYAIPWGMLSKSVDEALSLHLLERTPDSGPWPCSPVAMDQAAFPSPRENRIIARDHCKSAGILQVPNTPTLRAIKEAIEMHFFGGPGGTLDVFTSKAQAALTLGVAGIHRSMASGKSNGCCESGSQRKCYSLKPQLDSCSLEPVGREVRRAAHHSSGIGFYILK